MALISKKDITLNFQGTNFKLKEGQEIPAGLKGLTDTQKKVYFKEGTPKKEKEETKKK